VEEVLGVAPEHPAVLGAWVPDDALDDPEVGLRLVQAAEGEEAVPQVEPGVALDLGVGRLDRLG
jgi:hypothetical protein